MNQSYISIELIYTNAQLRKNNRGKNKYRFYFHIYHSFVLYTKTNDKKKETLS